MYTVSDRFLAALAESHTPTVEVKLFRTDGRVETLESITGGSVPVDRGASTRRTCSVTLADPQLIPQTPADKLSVYGAQLRISRGIQFSDGIEQVPLGVFRVDEVSGDVDDGPVTISGKSLECVVSDDKFTAPYKASGTAVGAITALIQRSIPSATIVNRATDAVIGPRTWDTQADPWDAVVECGTAIGAEVYADADGVFIVATLPDLLTTTPVWTIAAGEGGAYISADRGMSAANVFNGVLASGENTESDAPPVSYLATDTDTASPTYWGGPFGHRPTFYSSSTITTLAQATAAANLLLKQSVAPNASADISSLPNPALEPGDVLRVVYGDGRRELHQVQSFSVPLEAGGDFTVATISAKEDA